MSARGFAMTEVLAALAVIGVVVTGNLGLALGGLGATLEARRSQQAVALAADLAGRMRALPVVDWSTLPAAGPCVAPCAPEQVAAAELVAWSRQLEAALPEAAAELQRAGPEAMVLQLRWRESDGAMRSLGVGIPL